MPETSRKKILVVDDESDVADLVAYHLKANGFAVETVNDPTRSIGLARSFIPDLVILDVMMPEINGIQICRMLRADPKLKQVPVIFLTAKVEENDRIQGLENGADDYICKPFSTKELVLRVQNILRRTTERPIDAPPKLITGGIELDIERHEVKINEEVVELTATEFKLLHLLMERRGRVQTREHLLINVWNYETEIETRTVDTHVRRLREKLGDEAEWIETIRGVGYRMAERRAQESSA
ncbi:response regulator [Synoicihabitans lomoniglobus]|uniref:Phosphate regulon transcriptional regulatory protein PhoB n=1 Tax=Synoicihabitans lomoniglobus TaxID=2909285 RepID=A0AAF0CHP1_9BACT|nr:response regulator transcription factor [Opitutaceae bacterium LMO-M01]WED64532.1 response regulator transcription factor [Opitutaceae bacterium LMO-M01]